MGALLAIQYKFVEDVLSRIRRTRWRAIIAGGNRSRHCTGRVECVGTIGIDSLQKGGNLHNKVLRFRFHGFTVSRRLRLTLRLTLVYGNDSTGVALVRREVCAPPMPDQRSPPVPQQPEQGKLSDMADEESAATQTVQQELESTLDSVDQAEETVLSAARKMGFSEDEQHRIGIAVRECMVNAVVHGNCYNANKKVYLAVSSSPKQLEITISDEGEGFDLSQLPDPLAEENLLRQSGRGVLMIQAFMDQFEVRRRNPNGTEVKMTKLLESEQ